MKMTHLCKASKDKNHGEWIESWNAYKEPRPHMVMNRVRLTAIIKEYLVHSSNNFTHTSVQGKSCPTARG